MALLSGSLIDTNMSALFSVSLTSLRFSYFFSSWTAVLRKAEWGVRDSFSSCILHIILVANFVCGRDWFPSSDM